jgi:hypothetical protein
VHVGVVSFTYNFTNKGRGIKLKTKLITFSLCIALVIAVASPIFAQQDKTEIPPGITIPDMLLTHLGTLKFPEACPKRVLSDARRHSIAFPAKNLVEPTGFEPVTSSMPLRRSTN